MIPKIIHYCWFGEAEKPKLAKKCIDSWKKYCPDYTIIEWNEDNFDISRYDYTQWCYREKKWAFLSDFVRLIAVYENGGIYFDTDVELIKNPDKLLTCHAFYGYENAEFVATGLGFGAETHHPSVKMMIDIYLNRQRNSQGSYDLVNCPEINTEALLSFGLMRNGTRQSIDGIEIFPVDFFNPLDDATGRMHITENTYTINHYGKSWMDKKTVLRSRLTRPFHRLFGIDSLAFLRKK